MKKVVLTIFAVALCVIFIISYSTFKPKNFVDTFITNPDEYEHLVDSVIIWEKAGSSNVSLATLNRGDEGYEEVRDVLNDWEVKRVMFSEIDYNDFSTQIDIKSVHHSLSYLNIYINEDGVMSINGSAYQLVNGTSVKELIAIAK